MTPKFQLKAGLAIFKATSRSGTSNFIAELKDVQGNSIDLAANEIGASSSSRLTGITTDGTFLLAVEFDGAWTIEVSNPGSALANPIGVPTAITGSGTMVTRALSLPKGLLTVSYSSSGGTSNFIAELYDSNGGLVDLGANEIGVSNGSRAILVPTDGIYIFAVQFDGKWTLNLASG